MQIFYYLSHYISHYVAGLDYINCLKLNGHTLCAARPAESTISFTAEQADFARQADVIVLHEDPLAYPLIYAQLPFLKEKRVIAYVAWENELLSPRYMAPLKLVSEVWTCSDFCRAAISPHVKKCSVLPHLVQRPALEPADVHWGKSFLDDIKEQAEEFIFYSVIDAVNPRKNLQGLLAAFNLLRRDCRRPVRLLLKQYRLDMPLDTPAIKNVTSLTDQLSQGRMNALYALCDAYVSAHHAEGWGMGLSAAMAFGKPVIATGYSGNMQYMNSENSLPVP
ncbi:MAG: glycosyltransferase, partial [Deltaproteobacteria bacterium]|nr:glycosyltransferase [Deltaproteobacteria bacterium]